MSGIGTGLDAQLVVGVESTYNVAVTPNRAFEFDSETLARKKDTVQGTGLRAGGRFPRTQRRRLTTRSAAGNINGNFVTNGMGMFLAQACGTSTITVRGGAPTVYDQVHTPGSILGKSLTIQKGVPSTASGVVEPFTYTGCKITELDISIGKGGLAVVSMAIDAADELTTATTPAGPALVTPSFNLSAVPFSFREASLTLGGTPVAGVTKANVKLTRALNTDRFYLNSGGVKSEPLENAYQKVDGTIEADFVSRAAMFDSFVADTTLALVLFFDGPQIGATGIDSSLKITVAAAKLNGETPKVGGPDIVSMSVPYEGLDDGTNPAVKYELTSSDTAY